MKTFEEIKNKYGYSYKEIAKITNFSKPYIWQIFNRKRNMSYKQAIIIAKVFGKKPDELFYNQIVEDEDMIKVFEHIKEEKKKRKCK